MTEMVSGTVRFSNNDGRATIYINGSFVFRIQGDFRSAYEQLSKEAKSVTLDLSDADYMDSSGLGMLLVMKKNFDQNKVSYEISNARGQTLELLELTHFRKYFKINGEGPNA